MVSFRFLSARLVLSFWGFCALGLAACQAQTEGDTEGSAGSGIIGVGSGAGIGSAPAVAGSSFGSSAGVGNGGAGPGVGGTPPSGVGATAVAGSPNGGAGGGAAVCAGVTPWTAGTTASNVSHNGKRYSCKVAGWCASAASAYEPGVGFAWQDAWQEDGNCGSSGGAGAGSGGATGAAGSGNGSAGAPSTGCALDSVLGENNFQAWYPARNGFYTYANLCKAIAKYPAFATSGDTSARKREVAAFFANVARETGNLKFIDQISKDPANGQYWGRGPLQITWNYNYQACGKAIGVDLLGNPGLVSTDGAITWQTALWFWMTNDGGTGKTPHQAIVNNATFGGTIDAINGGLECNGPNEGATERIAHYQTYTQALGVDVGGKLNCW